MATYGLDGLLRASEFGLLLGLDFTHVRLRKNEKNVKKFGFKLQKGFRDAYLKPQPEKGLM